MNQRDMDIAIIEAQEAVRRIVEEWTLDYLGSRAERQAPSGAIQEEPLTSASQPNMGY